MSETSDWKQKYRDSMLEVQAEEDRWRKSEQVLRRLIGRLCAAGMGVDPKLDDELSALAAANRRNAEAEELARMAETLTTAVVAVDAVAPVIVAPRPQAPQEVTLKLIKGSVGSLLERLPETPSNSKDRKALFSELPAAQNEATLARLLERAADIIQKHSDQLARERLQAGAVLAEVTKRLEDVSRFLRESTDATHSQFGDSQTHNESVMWQVRELSGEISAATELNALQSLVKTRLERVSREISDFRAREENRLMEFNGRSEQMRLRIADLERESKELQARLDSEKNVARLDPLTNVANRKSFDERFARSLDSCRRGEGSFAMLLWDIDNFKSINDSYGHRAGDRVLQNVATCFSAAARGSDFVARIGGEEFVLLLSGVQLAEAMQIADRVRGAVESLRFHFRGTPVRVTACCGVTELRADDSPEGTFDRADAALYRAKHNGKNLCVAA
jgi:diguanylate cyclase